MKQGALKKCSEISDNPYGYLKDWKQQSNKKIIGCFAMHIPEEMVHAAGMLPVITWRSDEPVTLGHSHAAPYNCGLTRSFVDDVVKDKLDFIDGLVVNRMCLQAQGLPFIFEQNAKLPYLEYLSLPALYGGAPIRDFLMVEYRRFKAGLEKVADRPITDSDINQSIEIYNKNRKLLSDIYEIRRQKPGAVKASEMLSLVHSSMLMPKEENNKLLEDVIAELEEREPDPSAEQGLRVVTYGCLCQTPQPEILDVMEELGMVIVDDDIFVGSRYFANPVQEGIDPYSALGERYLAKTPACPTKGDHTTDWTDTIIEMVERTRAKGVVTLLVKYCPPHMCYYPDIKNKLADKGIPEIMIEVEHEIISLGQIKTRLQSFVEITGGV